jgi:hypothetical protein
VPVELKKEGPYGLEDPLLRRTRLSHLLPKPSERECDEIGQEEPQVAVVVGRDVLAAKLLLVELKENGKQEAFVPPAKVEEVPLGDAQPIVVLPLLDKPRHVPVNV